MPRYVRTYITIHFSFYIIIIIIIFISIIFISIFIIIYIFIIIIHPSDIIDDNNKHLSNIWGLHVDRNITIAKGIKVIVKGYRSKQAKSFVKSSISKVPTGNNQDNEVQEHHYQKRNMSDDEAQEFADNKRDEISRHEFTVNANMYGDFILNPRSIVKLQGTGTAFDQAYFLSTMTRELTMGGAFLMHATCKNKAEENGATP